MGRWLATDPGTHIKLWTNLNQNQYGMFVPVLKMIKGWNKSRSLLRSFHLETLACTIFQKVTISSYPSGARYFFDKSRAMLSYKLPDPAGYSDDVADYLIDPKRIQQITTRLDWAYTRALEAERLERAGRTSEAFDKWKLIFTDYFPSYG